MYSLRQCRTLQVAALPSCFADTTAIFCSNSNLTPAPPFRPKLRRDVPHSLWNLLASLTLASKHCRRIQTAGVVWDRRRTCPSSMPRRGLTEEPGGRGRGGSGVGQGPSPAHHVTDTDRRPFSLTAAAAAAATVTGIIRALSSSPFIQMSPPACAPASACVCSSVLGKIKSIRRRSIRAETRSI